MKGMKAIGMLLAVFLLVGSVFAAGVTAKQSREDKINRAKGLAEKMEKDLDRTGEYSEVDLEELIGLVDDLTGIKLDQEEKQIAKKYVIAEMKKNIKIKRINEKLMKGKDNVKSTKITPIKTKVDGAVMYKLSSGPIHWFVQPTVDINGGTGLDDAYWPYSINGNNDLYDIDVTQTGNWLIYTLTYYDEDHPSNDAYYDFLRWLMYGRIEDIETFYYYTNTNKINLVDLWSNDKTFAYPIGQHGDRLQTAQSIMYIATWNHAMDFNDNNPSLSKTWWYYS